MEKSEVNKGAFVDYSDFVQKMEEFWLREKLDFIVMKYLK